MPISTERARSDQGKAWPLIALVLAAAVVFALVAWTSPASADEGVFYVSATGDDATPCTEVEPCATIGHAIDLASGGDTIEVADGTYNEQITISKDLTLVGAGQSSTFIQAAASPEEATGRVIDVPAGVIVTIKSVTIRNGHLPQVTMTDGDDGGAGIRNAGVLMLQSVTVTHNHALGLNDGDADWALGGGIFSTGALTIRQSNINDNLARSAPAGSETRHAFGGGIYSTGTLTLEHSAILENEVTGNPHSPPVQLGMYGAGVYSTGDLTINGSYFRANVASGPASGSGARTGYGAAIYSSDGSLSVTNTRFEKNRAHNWGGAIYVTDADEPVAVTDSVFIENQGSSGGAIYAIQSDLQVLRSTLSKNTTTSLGGAINADGGSLEARSSTFDQNEGSSGGAIYYRPHPDAEGVSLLVDQSMFTENKATGTGSGEGGAISALRTSLRVTASAFTGNEGRVGGAVHLRGGPLEVEGSRFTGNSAREAGGAIRIDHAVDPPMPGELIVSGSSLSGNTAGTEGTEGTAIWFEAGGSAEATHNWWGEDVIPEGTIVGDVNSAPWCLAPDCGARIDVTLAGPGEGTVTAPTAATASCLEDACTFTYALDDLGATTSAALVATPTEGDAVGWSGVCAPDGEVAGIGVALSDAGPVQCTAILGAYNLTVALAGTGTGAVTSDPAAIDCGATCSAAFEPDTEVTLTATPAVGSTFAGWSGAGCATATLSITSNMTCTATFTLDQHDLTVTVTGPGSVTSAPAGIDCPETCAATFDYGTDVALTPAPDTGSVFLGWSGNAACDGTVTVTEPTACTAAFALPPIVEAPAPDVIEETGEVRVPVTGRQSTALPTDAPAVVGTRAPDGARIQVTVPPAALDGGGAEGLRLEVAVATDLEQVANQAPSPADADVVSQFVVRLVDAQGNTHPATFTEPVIIEFTLPADQVPDDADLEALILVFWNGEAWIEVEATATTHEDGSVTLTAEVQHFTLFSVLWAPPHWGAFDPAPAASGVTLVRWLGGGWTRLDAALGAALGEGGTAWRFVEGRALGYIPGAPSFVNRAFVEAYPDGVPPGTFALVTR
ncbi:MAG: DUF1565 domain-containing protein [Dehalococcoidia bacterium]|nr:DUF1565 domain-containing protein [Dehalococcoidia bacterium]